MRGSTTSPSETPVAGPQRTKFRSYCSRSTSRAPMVDFVTIWTGDIPLGWRHQQVLSGPRTVGPTGHVDLCSVVKSKWLQLHPLVAPFNLEVIRRDSADLLLRVQARSNEVDSEVVPVRVSWDGQWEDGATEMQRHLVVRIADDTA